MDSVSKQQYAHPLLFCPYARFTNEEDEFGFVQFRKSPILPSFTDKSSSSSHFRPLDLCSNIEGEYGKCQVCSIKPLAGTTYYSCSQCLYQISPYAMGYHKECIEPISKHPYHPKHSLRLQSNWSFGYPSKICLCCSYFSDWVYNCSICDFILCPRCARDPPVLAINHPKRHEHTLFYFLRKESLTCDVCALSHNRSLIYFCHQCGFVVHKECVYFPNIIRISRHEHRISFNSSLTLQKWLCGVCRGKIDTNYGRYSCVKGCSYGLHSKCATRGDVWDGNELEGKQEDAYEEDLKSFSEISDGVIQHFSHQNHHMSLDEETNREFDENKRCQACTLPICDDIIYKCMQCNFILHQACAHLLRKKQHVMHPHPLSLQVNNQGWCSACRRTSNGFMYVCHAMGCVFQLDVCCAFISDSFDYKCHPHSLFLTSDIQQTCSVCQRLRSTCLNCGDCGFALCFRCATLPNKQRYKHDEHFLILSYDKEASGQYWCDVCEKEADPKTNGIYMCNDCNITLHIKCLLGEEDIHMMSGGKIINYTRTTNILPNNHLTRSICTKCHNRCQGKIFYKNSEGQILCSFCLWK